MWFNQNWTVRILRKSFYFFVLICALQSLLISELKDWQKNQMNQGTWGYNDMGDISSIVQIAINIWVWINAPPLDYNTSNNK